MQEKSLRLKDLIIPVIEIVLLVLSIVFYSDLMESINSGTVEALASIVLIPLTLIFSVLSVVFNIIGVVLAFKQHRHKLIKWIQAGMLVANCYMLITTIIELI